MLRNHITAIGILAVAAGCTPHIKISSGLIDEVRVTELLGRKQIGSTTHPELISELVTLVNGASCDSTPYDCMKITEVRLLKEGSIQHTLVACGSIFSCRGKQYRDRSGAFGDMISMICSGIRGRATTEKPFYDLGEEIRIRWTLTNYRDEPLEVPAMVQGAFQWYESRILEGTRNPSWTGSDKMVASFEIDQRAPAMIEPDSSCILTITIPARTFGEGRFLISFSECPVKKPNDVVIEIAAVKGEGGR